MFQFFICVSVPTFLCDFTLTSFIHDIVSMDGFEEFYNSLDYVTQRALTICSDTDLSDVYGITGTEGSG